MFRVGTHAVTSVGTRGQGSSTSRRIRGGGGDTWRRIIEAVVRGSLTWDQGTEMARHAALALATDLPVYFAPPHSRWERPTNENTNGLIREYLPKGIDITDHQPYLDAIADELNVRPRAVLGFLTPREVFTTLLSESVVSTG
ncbi:IS30 family transposase [Rhodococcus oryzae]|uniref:IS30 family transposase n=1 Tax=Rhodococcus oryzae TaxID=2571143 RepID=UPI0037A33185